MAENPDIEKFYYSRFTADGRIVTSSDDMIRERLIDDFKKQISYNPIANINYNRMSGLSLVKSNIQPPIDIIHNICMKAGLTVFGGMPGEYKSYLALDCCLAVAQGSLFLGRKAIKGKCIYFDKEMRFPALKRRLNWLALGRGMSDDQLSCIEFVSDDKLTITEKLTFDTRINPDSKEFYKRIITETGASLIVFDSLVRFTAGDENNTADMKLLFQLCSELMQEFEVSIIVLHHLRKNNHRQYKHKQS